MSDAPAGKSVWGALTALLTLALALKLCVVLAPPADLLPTARGMAEELHRGNSAQEILRGPLLPIFDYQVNHFSGGSLVIVFLIVPFFALFGPNLVALRLATFLFNALGVVFAFLVLDRYVGRRAAWAGGLLMALCPPGYAMVSATAWGTHLEAGALAMVLLYVFLRLKEHAEEPPRLAFSFGVLSGFALYFGYVVALTLATLAAFELLYDKRFFLRRSFAIRLSGIALGLLPWLAYNVTHQFAGFHLYGRSLGQHFDGEKQVDRGLGTIGELLGRDLPGAFHFPGLGPVSGHVLNLVYYAMLVACIAAGLWLERAAVRRTLLAAFRSRSPAGSLSPAVLFVLYLAVFTAAYLSSDFRVAYDTVQNLRYAMPPEPWLFLAAAAGVQALANRAPRPAGALAMTGIGLLAVLSVVGNLAHCDFERTPRAWNIPATSDAGMGRYVAMRLRDDLPTLERYVDGLIAHREEDVQHQVLYSIGLTYKGFLKFGARAREVAQRDRFINNLNALRARVPEAFRPYLELPVEGERLYPPHLRERFWEDWRARQP